MVSHPNSNDEQNRLRAVEFLFPIPYG